MRPKLARPDQLTADIASRQQGVVTIAQLYRAGLTPDAVKHRVRTLSDLRGAVGPEELRNAIRAAEIAGLPIGDYGRLTQCTRSELELRFLHLIRRAGLPSPR